jgi:hypothetical protein
MSPAHVEAGKSIKNAVVNKAVLHFKRLFNGGRAKVTN